MELTKFKHEVLGTIDVINANDEILFKLADVCRILEIGNPSQAKARLDKDDSKIIDLNTLINNEGLKINNLGNPNVTFVTEAGLYSCIFTSRKQMAKEFKRWVFEEVLPSIRKHGAYMTPEKLMEMLRRPESINELLSTLKEEQTKRLEAEQKLSEVNEKNVELNKDSVYLKKVMVAEDLVSTSHIANMVGLTAREVNAILEKAEVQYSKGGKWYLKAMPARKQWGTQVAHDLESGKTVHYLKWTSIGKREVLRILDKLGYTPTSIKEAIKVKQQELFPTYRVNQ